MAGIAGFYKCDRGRRDVEEMLGRLSHRGPDVTHITVGDGFVLGCCDSNTGTKSTGAHAGGDKAAMVYDGLLFNRVDSCLKDAEAIWELQRLFKRNFTSHIDGPYCIAYADDEGIRLMRDHIGSRPLFYAFENGGIRFASEVKALLPSRGSVQELPPGTIYSSRSGIRPASPAGRRGGGLYENPETAKRDLRDALFEATRKRMNDGAVGGVALSGGLDSSIIAAIACRIKPDLHLFTIGLEGSTDIDNARLMASFLGAENRHHIHVISEDEIGRAVRDAIWYLESFEEDCVSGCIANMFAARLAARYTNCCLCGEGADELFGGYHLLKDISGSTERNAMMERLIHVAYNTGLRRLDRGWLSASVNYRTPFLDSRVLEISRAVPDEWKIHGTEQTEKWILRRAFHSMLPGPIALRRKLRFAGGSNVDNVMDRIAGTHMSAGDYQANRTTRSGFQLNSPKELWYYRIFTELFPDRGCEDQVVRWDPFK